MSDFRTGDLVVSTIGMRALRTNAWWIYEDGSTTGFDGDDSRWFRRLVVIDPENREQVERLVGLIDRHEEATANDPGDDVHTWEVAAMQAALREFANPAPPKPEEPKGLGAVVEDAEGRRWVRFNSAESSRRRWTDGTGDLQWSQVAAVRVLSEGVPA